MTRFNIHHPIETCFKYIAQANPIPATIVPQSINTHSSARLSRSWVFIVTSPSDQCCTGHGQPKLRLTSLFGRLGQGVVKVKDGVKQ